MIPVPICYKKEDNGQWNIRLRKDLFQKEHHDLDLCYIILNIDYLLGKRFFKSKKELVFKFNKIVKENNLNVKIVK